MSAQLTWRALDEAGEARTAANRPAFPLKLPRWSCTLRQRAYNRRESVSKMEIPDRRLRDRFQGHLAIAEVQRGFVFVK